MSFPEDCKISSMACVSPEAQIGHGVEIGPFATIEANVVIGDGCKIMNGATVCWGTRMGKNNRVFPNAVVGGVPQDLKFHGEETTCEIGDNNTIRECATINRGTASRGKTVVGSNNLIMAYCHIGHDCVFGNNIIISNACQFAGEVEVSDFAVIGGGSLCHQFTRVGRYVMVTVIIRLRGRCLIWLERSRSSYLIIPRLDALTNSTISFTMSLLGISASMASRACVVLSLLR